MSDEIQPPPPPLPRSSTPRRPARGRNNSASMWALGLGCSGALVVVAIMAGLFAWLMIHGNKEFEPYVNAYLMGVEAGDLDEIWTKSHPRLKESADEEMFVAITSHIHETLGDYQDKSFRGVNISSFNGQSSAQVTYAVTLEHGEALMRFLYMREPGDEYALAGIHYESELLRNILICPKCGHQLQSFSLKCPQCAETLIPHEAEADQSPGID